MNKNRVVVRIDGMEYALTANETAEYMNRLADYVNQKLQEVSKVNPSLNTTETVILTSVNIADDYFKAKQGGPDYMGRISELEDIILKLENELSKSSLEDSKDKESRA